MRKPFESSGDAEKWFISTLPEKGFEVQKVVDAKIVSGRGRIITQKRVFTESRDVFQVAFWSQLYRLVATEDLREEFARERDRKLKTVLKTFGYGDINVLGLQMSAVLDLVDLSSNGFFAHLTFLIKDGRSLWCTAQDFYNFVLRYDSLLLHSPTYGGEFCIVPVAWLQNWDTLPLRMPPAIEPFK